MSSIWLLLEAVVAVTLQVAVAVLVVYLQGFLV
jgi:hypothetical protein